MNKLIILGVIMVIVGAGYFFYQADKQNRTLDNPKAPATTQMETSEEKPAVTIQNFAFGPTEVVIKKGTTVTWKNIDSSPHTVTANDGAFSSPTINEGDTFTFTFNTPGTYGYHCNLHPSMQGKIVVE